MSRSKRPYQLFPAPPRVPAKALIVPEALTGSETPVSGPVPEEPVVSETAATPAAEPEEDDMKQVEELAEKLARMQKWAETMNDWAEAAGVAEMLLIRDGFGSKTYVAACERREALRAKMSETIRA